MVIARTSIEKESTPGKGVIFYQALQQLDNLTIRLLDEYPRYSKAPQKTQGLANDQPFSFNEYKDRVRDMGDAIKRGILGAALPRTFDGPQDTTIQSSPFLKTIMELVAHEPVQLAGSLYTQAHLPKWQGGYKTFLARVDEDFTVLYGCTVTIPQRELTGFREASADDCVTLVDAVRAEAVTPSDESLRFAILPGDETGIRDLGGCAVRGPANHG